MAWKYLVKHKHNYVQSYFFGEKTTDKSVAITNQSFLFLILGIMRDSSAKIENKNQCSIIKKIMYEKSCYKSSTSKYEKSNSNINISKILHLHFDMLCYLPEYMMTLSKIHWQLASTLKRPVVQNCANGTTK